MLSIQKVLIFSTFASELLFIGITKAAWTEVLPLWQSLTGKNWLGNAEIQHLLKLLPSPHFYRADILYASVILYCSLRHSERAEKSTKEPKKKTGYGLWYSQWKSFERQNIVKKCSEGMIQLFSQAILPHIKGSLVFWGWLVKLNLKMALLISYQRFVMMALR